MAEQPAANIPPTDLYSFSTDGGGTRPRRLVAAYGGYSNLIEIDRDRVGIRYDGYPRLSFRTFYLENCT